MNIAEVDKNLKVETALHRDDIVWYDASKKPFVLYGNCKKDQGEYGKYLRIYAPGLKGLGIAENIHTSGIRVHFRTDSPFVAIKAVWRWQCSMPHMPFTGSSGFDLYAKKNDKYGYIGTFVPPLESPHGHESIREFSTGEFRDYLINFPLYNDVTELYIGVQEGARFETPAGYRNQKPVIFYGSSITQGGCASRPGNSYMALLSRALNFDFVNLGFSGCAKGEPILQQYIADQEMSAFVCDYDYNTNIESPELLEQTHFAMYQKIRKKHPDIPYLMISKHHGATMADKQSRTIIMDSYRRAVALGDQNVYFVDGRSLFAELDPDACTVDGGHPNDLGFYRMYLSLLPLFAEWDLI